MADLVNKERFSFTFSYELDDLLKAHSAYKKTRSSYRLSVILKVFLVAAIVVELINVIFLFFITVLLRHLSGNPGVNQLVKMVAITVAVFILLLAVSILMLDETIFRWRIKRSYRKHQTGDVEYEIIVDYEGLQVNVTDWKTWMGWSQIQRVVAYTYGFLFFFKVQDYLNIPNRVFEDSAEIEAFIDLASKSTGIEVDEIK